jgi:outer membrane lipoprotein-sorting protein
VNLRTVLTRHRALRWLAPVGVLAVAAVAATGMFKQPARPATLPDTSPAALLAAVQTSHVTGFSGTVVSTLSLGLPELPGLGGAAGGTDAGSSLTSLLSGSHTMQVWYGALDEQRVALLGATDETDVFRNGRSVWEWSSADRKAVHLTLPAVSGKRSTTTAAPPSTGAGSLTPPALARRALAALDPTTAVRVVPGGRVADRSTYELVLTPRTTATRIGSVRVDVDGATKIPLAVRVFARGATSPAVDVAFTSIRFHEPAKRNFQFTPPPDATVRHVHAGTAKPATSVTPAPGQVATARPQLTVRGSGWARVVATRLPKTAIASVQRNAVYESLTPVTGSWGKGRLLQSALVSVLLTTDGRVYAGAVPPAALYAAASK